MGEPGEVSPNTQNALDDSYHGDNPDCVCPACAPEKRTQVTKVVIGGDGFSPNCQNALDDPYEGDE